MHRVPKPSDVLAFLKANVRNLDGVFAGPRHRTSVRLVNGTALPRVVFESEQRQVEFAHRCFDEVRGPPDDYRRIVAAFVVSGNRIATWDIASSAGSPFALDVELLRQNRDEASMGWTGFDVAMRAGHHVSMGTRSRSTSTTGRQAIHQGALPASSRSGTRSHRGLPPYIAKPDSGGLYREKPCFTGQRADL